MKSGSLDELRWDQTKGNKVGAEFGQVSVELILPILAVLPANLELPASGALAVAIEAGE